MMTSTSIRVLLAAALMLCANRAGMAQEKAAPPATEKKPATIKILLQENLFKPAEVKIEGVVTKQTGSERTFQTPALEPGKTFVYKIEAVIEPNNYTKIFRTREIT